ncbi:hypothetical protein [Enterococcus dongliensis]|nr:hypothetical protein [Enterococcus dongliensis]
MAIDGHFLCGIYLKRIYPARVCLVKGIAFFNSLGGTEELTKDDFSW